MTRMAIYTRTHTKFKIRLKIFNVFNCLDFAVLFCCLITPPKFKHFVWACFYRAYLSAYNMIKMNISPKLRFYICPINETIFLNMKTSVAL